MYGVKGIKNKNEVGNGFQLSNFEVSGNTVISYAEILAALRVVDQSPGWKEMTRAKVEKAVANLYKRHGYRASVYSYKVKNGKLSLTIMEKKIGDIKVIGKTVDARNELLANKPLIKPYALTWGFPKKGDIFHEGKVRQALERASNPSLFNQTEYYLDESNPQRIDITIDVIEKQDPSLVGSAAFGKGVSETSLGLKWNSIKGRGKPAGFNFEYSKNGEKKGGAVSGFYPLNYRTTVRGHYKDKYEHFSEGVRHVSGAGLGMEKDLTPDLILDVGLKTKTVGAASHEYEGGEETTHLVTGKLTYDRRRWDPGKNMVTPIGGGVLSLGGDAGLAVPKSREAGFTGKMFVEGDQYFSLTRNKKLVLSLHGFAGAGKNISRSRSFWVSDNPMTGNLSVRGANENPSGDKAFGGRTELGYTVLNSRYLGIRPFAFIDGASAWSSSRDFSGNFQSSYGLGTTVVLNLPLLGKIPLSFYYGIPFGEGLKGGKWGFGISL